MRGLATKTLSALFESIDIAQHLRRKRTYPGFFPLLHLDHIYYEGDVTVRSMELVRTRKALIASDHLPLVADFRIGFQL
jgi:endonuclease/exonuclease/phosphatase family metal-dependent hydrolase